MKTADDDVYHINGHWTIDWPRKVQAAGTVFHYERPKGQPESMYALGPIEQEIAIMVNLVVLLHHILSKREKSFHNKQPQV